MSANCKLVANFIFTCFLFSNCHLFSFSSIDTFAIPRSVLAKDVHLNESEVHEKIKNAIEWHNYQYLGRLLKENVGRTIALNDVRQIARELQCQKLFHAVEATAVFYKQQSRVLGLPRSDFLQIALFIETNLQEFIQKKQHYIPKEETSLATSLEYDPKTRKIFIILPDNKQTHLGQGKNKVVMKAILYQERNSEVVARALQTKVREIELKTTNDLKGAKGVMEIVACTEYNSNGTTYRTIYSKLYNPGALQRAFSKRMRFSVYEKMKIALNILNGLEELHKRNIAHRDLSAVNCLIDIPKGSIGRRNVIAVIADFGRSNSILKTYDKRLNPQGHSAYMPPEAIFKGKVQGEQVCRTDIYAAGCIFYQLFHGKLAPWQNSKYVQQISIAEFDRHKALVSKINHYTAARRSKLEHKRNLGIISPCAAFELLILRMCQPDAEKRGTASELHQMMQKIFDQHSMIKR